MNRLTCAIGLACVAASPAASQAASQVTDTTSKSPPVAVWASLSAGPGHASNRSTLLLGAQAALHAAYDSWVAVYHRGGASGFESGGAWDDAAMIGRRIIRRHTTLLWAVGPAAVHDESNGGSWSTQAGPAKAAIAFTTEAAVTAHVVGFGVAAFGAWSQPLSYIGVGITLHAGWIQ